MKKLEIIREIVSSRFMIDITVKSRELKYVIPRQCYYKISKELTNHSYIEMVNNVGLTNHATVSNGLTKFEYDIKGENLEKYKDCLEQSKASFMDLETKNYLLSLSKEALIGKYISSNIRLNEIKRMYNDKVTSEKNNKHKNLYISKANKLMENMDINELEDVLYKIKTMTKVRNKMNEKPCKI